MLQELVGLDSARQLRWMIVVCLAYREGRGAEQPRCFRRRDPHDLEVMLEEVGDDECIFREDTKAVVGTSFGGVQLDRLAF